MKNPKRRFNTVSTTGIPPNDNLNIYLGKLLAVGITFPNLKGYTDSLDTEIFSIHTNITASRD